MAHACHALALDEERESFKPVLWDESKTTEPDRIEQVWFAGVHSNVGGGYPRQGMSLVALDWMMTKAEAPPHNLRFVREERLLYRYHADVDDKKYDSRAGLGVFYRWLPRNVQRLCADNGVTPKVHRSVFERIARNTEGYAPGSVPPDPEVISMSQSAAVTGAVRALVRLHHGSPTPLIEREAGRQRLGRASYWLFVWGVIIALLLCVKAVVLSAMRGASTWRDVAANFGFESAVLSSPVIAVVLVVWLVVTLPLALTINARLDRRYSQFWHADYMRLKLRNALGLG